MMHDVTCPYCEHDLVLSHDDGAYYDENGREECQCPECEKYCMVTSSVQWSHTAEKADCLNGGEHIWKDTNKGKQRCTECDEERTYFKM